jgi:hypothetical protein
MAGRVNEHERECRRLSEILVPAMREKARRLGYALAIHGSLGYDIDIIAAPWRDDCVCPAIELMEAMRVVCESITGMGFLNPKDATKKPHGRLAWSIHVGGGPYVDLSVMPRVESEPEKVSDAS